MIACPEAHAWTTQRTRRSQTIICSRYTRPPLLRRYYIDITDDAMVCSFDSESTNHLELIADLQIWSCVDIWSFIIYHLMWGGSQWVFMWRSTVMDNFYSHSCWAINFINAFVMEATNVCSSILTH